MTLLTAAAVTTLLLGGASSSSSSAAPPPVPDPILEARAPERPTTDDAAAWVTVDTSGTPVTVTPVVSVDVVDGTTTTVSAAPNDLTATVVTRTRYAEVTTSTGTTAPAPTATNKNGAGSFLACDNVDGEYAPFCQPAPNSSLYPGTTYYGELCQTQCDRA